MTTPNMCKRCDDNVSMKQEGLICDDCRNWFHRKCFNNSDVAMTREHYRLLKKQDVTFEWKCLNCYQAQDTHHDSNPIVVSQQMEPSRRLVDYSDSECSEISPIPRDDVAFAFPDIPSVVNESSIEATNPRELLSQRIEEAFFTIEDALSLSQRGKAKLHERGGYSYTLYRTNANGTVAWRCSVRRKGNVCPAKVQQKDDEFIRNKAPHSHGPVVGERQHGQLKKLVGKRGLENPYTTCGIVAKMARKEIAGGRLQIGAVKGESLKRLCNGSDKTTDRQTQIQSRSHCNNNTYQRIF
uniref:uncharacterized protein LOC120341597 n=1 Tax=Styela clava TaxID=7725 RepID=UPI0019394667|nr:uncharacterized protein LOC120341597 [Styela clava]XP_039266069.1 uncharacterized protein LOC120341597 [Styela clava]